MFILKLCLQLSSTTVRIKEIFSKRKNVKGQKLYTVPDLLRIYVDFQLVSPGESRKLHKTSFADIILHPKEKEQALI